MERGACVLAPKYSATLVRERALDGPGETLKTAGAGTEIVTAAGVFVSGLVLDNFRKTEDVVSKGAAPRPARGARPELRESRPGARQPPGHRARGLHGPAHETPRRRAAVCQLASVRHYGTGTRQADIGGVLGDLVRAHRRGVAGSGVPRQVARHGRRGGDQGAATGDRTNHLPRFGPLSARSPRS